MRSWIKAITYTIIIFGMIGLLYGTIAAVFAICTSVCGWKKGYPIALSIIIAVLFFLTVRWIHSDICANDNSELDKRE